MRVRYLLLSGLVAAAAVVAACGETTPLAGEGTNTQYDLSFAITSPATSHVFASKTDSVLYTYEVTDNTSGKIVPNAVTTTATFSTGGIAKTATCNSPTKANPKAVPFPCIRATGSGSTTLTDTFVNMNTGAVLSSSTALTVP